MDARPATNEELSDAAQRAGITRPIYSHRVVGDRIELYAGDNEPVIVALEAGKEPTKAGNLNDLTVAELKELAGQRGLTGYSKLSKKKLIALLESE